MAHDERTGNTGNRDLSAIQREIHETQARLGETLDAIRRKLEPHRMIDQVSDMFKNLSHSRSGHMTGMGDTVRDNALPLTLIGLGLGWLMWSNTNHPSVDAKLHDARRWARQRARDSMSHMPFVGSGGEERNRQDAGEDNATDYNQAGYAGGTPASVPDRYRNDLGMAYGSEDEDYSGEYHYRDPGTADSDRLRSPVGGYADDMQGRHGLRDRAGRYGSQIRDYSKQAKEQARYYRWQARQGASSLRHTIEDHPMMSSLIGFAIGAAVGALLPSSRYEDEWIGDYRDTLLDRGRHYGEDALGRAADVARTAAEAGYEAARDAAQEEAERQGLTPQQIRERAEENSRS